VFGSIIGSIPTKISLMFTIISSDTGSSRASPILGCPQPKPSKKIRMFLAFSSLNICLNTSRASSVIFMSISSCCFYLIARRMMILPAVYLFPSFGESLNTTTDFIADTLEKCPFFFIRSLGFSWIIKSPVHAFDTWRSDWAFVSRVTA
jgi:hypothetical protein